MAELPNERRERRRPPRCRMIHPYVEEQSAAALEICAHKLRLHPDQLAGWLIDTVMASDELLAKLKMV